MLEIEKTMEETPKKLGLAAKRVLKEGDVRIVNLSNDPEVTLDRLVSAIYDPDLPIFPKRK